MNVPMTRSLRADIGRRRRVTSGRRRKLRGLLELLAPYRGRALLTALTLLAGTAAMLAPAPLAQRAIDDGIRRGNTGTLTLIVIGFVLSALLVWGTGTLQTYLTNWVGQRALADLRSRIFAHLQTMPVSFYERRKAGVLISRMTNDVDALTMMVTDSITTLVQSVLLLGGSIVILLTFDVKLALITFLIFPVLLIGSLIYRLASADAFARTRSTIGAVTANLQESLSGIRVVRSFAQEARHIHDFDARNLENLKANKTTVNLNAAYFPAVELVGALATVLVLLYGGHQALQGNITVGILVGFIAALGNFFDPIQQLSQVYSTYQSGMAALDKIFELLDEQPSMTDAQDAIDLPHPIAGEIVFADVTFSYSAADGTKVALRDIQLTIAPGETIALVGATGAGKSTFAKLVARFYDPTDGSVLIDGHDLRTVTARSLRSQLGIVPQEGFLFSGTIGDNIALGIPSATEPTGQAAAEAKAAIDDRIEQACRAVGAWEFIERLPAGLDTEIGERGVKLSAGQRQLVELARALAADPRILVLDEATANVDLHTEGIIEQGLRSLLEGRTAIIVAHRLSTIRRASRIVVLDHGRIVEVGSHDQLLARPDGRYRALYRHFSEQTTA